MILYVMMAKEMLWISAKSSDTNYEKYLKKRETGFPPFEMLESSGAKMMLYKLLNPDPSARPEAEAILEDSWVKGINMCQAPNDRTSSTEAVESHIEPSQHIHLTVPIVK
jgi:serine/threonine protein kinase